MKATEQYFPVVLFIILYKMVLTFESVDEILKCDHSNESYWAVRSCGAVYHAVNLVPRAFSSFKMAVGETPGQGCWNTPRIVEYFVTWHIMKWLFRRLFPASGGPVCFLQSETVIQTKRRHLIVFVWRNSNELLEPLWQPWPGVSPTAILNEEKALGGVTLSAGGSEQTTTTRNLCLFLHSLLQISSVLTTLHLQIPRLPTNPTEPNGWHFCWNNAKYY